MSTHGAPQRSVTIEAGSPLRPTHMWLFVVLLSALAMEGADVKILSFAAPQILHAWGVSKTAFSAALAAPLIGMAPGASAGGALGDRLGRRFVALVSTLMFGVCTVAMSMSQDISTLTALRFISGLGCGALLPNAYALAVEWMPARYRASSLSVLTVATPLGGALSAAIVAWLLPAYGWRLLFAACGLVTCLNAAAMLIALPESYAYLLGAGSHDRARREWTRVTGEDLPAALLLPPGQDPADAGRASSRGELFRRAWVRLLATSAVIFFAGQFVNYALGSWLPVIITGAGFTLTDALGAVFAYNCCAVVGGIVAVNVAQFAGARAVMIALCALMMALLAATPSLLGSTAEHGLRLLMLTSACGLIGLGTGGIAGVVSTFISVTYPVRIRSAGVGFGVMWGRIGAVIAIVVGGILLDLSADNRNLLFWLLAMMMGSALIAASLLRGDVSRGVT